MKLRKYVKEILDTCMQMEINGQTPTKLTVGKELHRIIYKQAQYLSIDDPQKFLGLRLYVSTLFEDYEFKVESKPVGEVK
jgi:hypothetical protein